MRNFSLMDPNERIPVKVMLSAKHAAILQREAKDLGLTMSGYLNVYLRKLGDEKEKERYGEKKD